MFAISRLGTIARTLTSRVAPQVKNVRHGSGGELSYRMPGPAPDMPTFVKAHLMGGLLWYWILFHLYYDFGHLVGHHHPPDPTKWTDAELGILPEDED